MKTLWERTHKFLTRAPQTRHNNISPNACGANKLISPNACGASGMHPPPGGNHLPEKTLRDRPTDRACASKYGRTLITRRRSSFVDRSTSLPEAKPQRSSWIPLDGGSSVCWGLSVDSSDGCRQFCPCSSSSVSVGIGRIWGSLLSAIVRQPSQRAPSSWCSQSGWCEAGASRRGVALYTASAAWLWRRTPDVWGGARVEALATTMKGSKR